MRKRLALAIILPMIAVISGCAHIPGGTDLRMVQEKIGMRTITTGDGTFENYTAIGHYSSTEIGISLGIPFVCKIYEIYPAQSNEEQLGRIAKAAKDQQASSMINVTPHKTFFTGFPFFILGIHLDKCDGTGIYMP